MAKIAEKQIRDGDDYHERLYEKAKIQIEERDQNTEEINEIMMLYSKNYLKCFKYNYSTEKIV